MLLSEFTKKAAIDKKLLKDMAIGFLAGTIGSNLASIPTYPLDTKNVREQTGKPIPKTLREYYTGFGTKMIKNTATIGLTFAMVKPVELYLNKILRKRI